jgi:adhesin/invasin
LGDYWTSDVNDITGRGYVVSLAHGFSRNGNDETRYYAVCIDALPSGTEVIANNDFNVVSNALANGSHTNALSATVKDANGNRVPNVGVTFAVTKGKATPESQRVQTDANGVATAKLVSLVAGDNLVTATVGGKTAEAKTSTFVAPQITSVSVNGATFDVDKGFPTTGFKGAEFSLVIAETSPLNYTWSSSASWAQVNTTGKVSFKSQGNSSPVTITAEPKAGGTALTYTVTVKSWFSHYGSKPQWFWDAMNYCTNRPNHVMPAINEMIFSDAPTQRVAGSNKLLSEWGSPGSYSESEFKTNTAYWLSNPFSQGERWIINPDTGALNTTGVSGWSGFAICRQELKPLY